MDDMLLLASANGAGSAVRVPPGESEYYYQHQEVYSESIPGNRISGDDGKFSDNGDETARGENQES